MSDKEIKTSKPAYKYGLIIAEPQKRLWVCEMDKGVVLDTLYTDTWGGNRMKGTREKAIENAKLIVKALNTFDASVDTPYCHDLEQRIELFEMQMEEEQAKAEELVRVLNAICVLFDNGERKITVGERANLMIAKALIEKYSKEWTE